MPKELGSLKPDIVRPKEKLTRGSHILIVSDYDPDPKGQKPLINGIQSIVNNLQSQLEAADYRITVLHPFSQEKDKSLFRRVPFGFYPGFEITIASPKKVAKVIDELKPNAILNVTSEGPLGVTVKMACTQLNKERSKDDQIMPTAVYTLINDEFAALYLKKMTKGVVSISPSTLHTLVRRLFRGTHKVLVHTPGMRDKLHELGVDNTVLWPTGVDSEMFHLQTPEENNPFTDYEWYAANPKPIYLYYGRLASEKNIDDFLDLDTPEAHKVIIGDGPERARLEQKYANLNTHFLDTLRGNALASHVRFSDIMVFPGTKDTGGQAILESGASGVPVVAYDVPGSGELVVSNVTGIKVPRGESLATGIAKARMIDRRACSDFVTEKYSWKKSADILLENLQPIQWNTTNNLT